MSENFLNDYEKNRNKQYKVKKETIDHSKSKGESISDVIDKPIEVEEKKVEEPIIKETANVASDTVMDIDDPYLLDKEYRDTFLKNESNRFKKDGMAENSIVLVGVLSVVPIIFTPFIFIYTTVTLLFIVTAPFLLDAGLPIPEMSLDKIFLIPFVISIIIALIVFVIVKCKRSKDSSRVSLLKNKIEQIDKGNYTYNGLSPSEIDYAFIKKNIQLQLSKDFNSTVMIARNPSKRVLIKYLDIDNDTEGIDLNNLDNLINENQSKINNQTLGNNILKFISILLVFFSFLLFTFYAEKADISSSASNYISQFASLVSGIVGAYPIQSFVILALVLIGFVMYISASTPIDDSLYLEKINLVTLKQRLIEKEKSE